MDTTYTGLAIRNVVLEMSYQIAPDTHGAAGEKYSDIIIVCPWEMAATGTLITPPTPKDRHLNWGALPVGVALVLTGMSQ